VEASRDSTGVEPAIGGTGIPTRGSTVARVLAVLEAVAHSRGGVGIRPLARETGIDRSAVSRLLRQLTELGATAPGAVPGRYVIGPRLFALAGTITSRDELRAAAKPYLEAIAGRFNETCYLAVVESGHVVYRDRIESRQPIRYVAELGEPIPLHAGAAGRAVLAGMTDEAFEAWLASSSLELITEATPRHAAELRALRSADRARGYSVSRGERVPGGAAVASPFREGEGRAAGSLVVTCPAERLTDVRETEVGHALAAIAGALSWRLGERRLGQPDPGPAQEVSA
jgi:DNA-binding IclR family transcriptional regulator